MALQSATAAITAQNTFTGAIQLHGQFNFSLRGTFSATITVQRSYDNSTWHDVEEFTAEVERVGFEPESNVWYRAGVKTGDYNSGTANVRLSQ